MTNETDRAGETSAKPRRNGLVSGRPTLKTIAEMTGLSLSTVSLSLRGGTALKEETRRRVAEAARKIGYVPDSAGVRLRTGKTSVIALVLSSTGHSIDFTRHMIAGVGKGVAGTQYHLTVVPEVDDGDAVDTVRHILETNTADGVIITHTAPRDRRVQLLMEADFPFVCHGRTEFAAAHAYHDFHSEAFSDLAVTRLAALGCRRLLLALTVANTMNYRNILTSYQHACARAGVIGEVNDADLVSLGGFDEVRRFGRQLARRADRPDGVICSGELYAIALFGGLADEGVVMGRDVKLVCKETSDILPIVFPQSDGIAEDVVAAGRELARLLLLRIDGAEPATLQTLSEPIPRWRCPAPAHAA